MKRALLLLLCLFPGALLAAPSLDLDMRLDPARRKLVATAMLADPDGLSGFLLAPGFRISSMTVDGKAAKPTAEARHDGQYRLPQGSRRVELSYQGDLPELTSLDHRQVLHAHQAMAAAEGSYLPAGSGWYPDPGGRFDYRLTLSLPLGQKGLVPGDLVKESEESHGYRAEFVYPHPAEGIDLMAGPYVVGERSVSLPDGRPVRIRTWFHGDLADLSPGYLEDTARYLLRYSRLIGDYPFGVFSIVSSPLPTGFGMPSLTYLGRDVIRLPFIRATSLGHEVLHNWWGNGVYPDWEKGNWSEGLTTFLADYAYREDTGEEAAREMRLGWLRDLAAVPPSEDIALKDFVSRRHGISSIIGYNKSAMVFLMLRDLVGRGAFEQGLRLLWKRKRFQTAAWADLEAAFSEAAGRPLSGFFQQWVERPGSSDIRLRGAVSSAGNLKLLFSQTEYGVRRVPVRLVYADRSEDIWVDVGGLDATVTLDGKGGASAVQLDPEYRLWRRIDPALMPAILREVFVAPKVSVLILDQDRELRSAAMSLAGKVLDAEPEILAADGKRDSAPLLVMGTGPAVDAWLDRQGLPPKPHDIASAGSAQVWAGRDVAARPYAVVSAPDAEALKALERGLPHYGRQSWISFEGARATAKGTWPAQPTQVKVQQQSPGH